MWNKTNLAIDSFQTHSRACHEGSEPVLTKNSLVIQGPCQLSGQHYVPGFKHSFVTLAALACTSDLTFEYLNCPDIQETSSFLKIIQQLGGVAQLKGQSFTVNASSMHRCLEAEELDSKIHGAVYLVPAMLKRTGRALMDHGGGCQIGDAIDGARPIDHYIDVFERFGAITQTKANGAIEVSASKLHGCIVNLLDYTETPSDPTGPKWSGASKMALLMSAISEGTSEIYHLYPKPDVMEMLVVMEKMGIQVEYLKQDSVRITSKTKQSESIPRKAQSVIQHTIIPDLIEIVTWICVGTLYANPTISLQAERLSCALIALKPELMLFEEMGVHITEEVGTLIISKSNHLQPVEAHACSMGIFSDSQPFFGLLATFAQGQSMLTESVWKNRFDYANGLELLGCDVEIKKNNLFIRGGVPPQNVGCDIWGNDLRAAAVLLIAALGVSGRTILHGTHHLRRGYEALPDALNKMGAAITSGERIQ